MVKRADQLIPQTPFDESFSRWLGEKLNSSNAPARVEEKLLQMFDHAKDKAISSEQDFFALFAKGAEIASILTELNVDANTFLSALLYPLVDARVIDQDKVIEVFSDTIAKRINGVESMNAIRALQQEQSEQSDHAHLDNLRRMLLVMVDDVRVVLIKLAERLCALRHAKGSEKEVSVAKEVMDIYAPLANRLGLGQLKWEMEDLAFRYLHPREYKAIAKHLAEKRVQREIYVNNVLEILRKAIGELGIKAEVMGRAKHIYSIWKKMQRKQVGFEEIYDVRAVRVLVPEIKDCYSVLGVVHGLWNHIPKEFDDYIATPKENGYRSLHTAVIGPEGKTLEVQIRTFAMHEESELGVAAHWRYKEGGQADGYETKIAWLRQLLEWQEDVAESGDLADEFRNQMFDERVYVFTPQGKLIDLPKGATAIDFAYRVHTDVGHRCRGAKANGRIIPLNQPLETGQKVEILTAKTGGPSRDWLLEHKGYIRSARARNKVNQWFRLQDKDKNAAAGKNLLEKEFAKHRISDVDLLKLARQFNYNSEQELFAGIGAGDRGIQQVMNAVRQQLGETVDKQKRLNKVRAGTSGKHSDILVEGVGNLLTRLANCCRPAPGDSISGYVTQSRGIMIHRSDCRYLLQAANKSPQRVLQVSWSEQVCDTYQVDLLIKAYDRKGLLADITSLLGQEKVSVTALRTQVNPKRLMVNIHLQIEVENIEQASRIMNLLEQLNNVVSVARKH